MKKLRNGRQNFGVENSVIALIGLHVSPLLVIYLMVGLDEKLEFENSLGKKVKCDLVPDDTSTKLVPPRTFRGFKD